MYSISLNQFHLMEYKLSSGVLSKDAYTSYDQTGPIIIGVSERSPQLTNIFYEQEWEHSDTDSVLSIPY